MFNFKITFNYPWLFLLLIPAICIVLIPYFRSAKRYRRNRNRITSIVLGLVVMTLSITALVGINFEYDVYNSENEIMLVVDSSYSTKEEKEAKDSYVNGILSMTNTRVFKVGVITFGFDQQYAVPLTNNLSGAYEKYINAPAPDTSATNISAALTYADSLFEKPESAKIILISDGVETDDNAQAVIKTIASRGVRIDTIRCSAFNPQTEVQILNAEFPDYNIPVDDTVTATLNLQSNYSSETTVKITMTDRAENSEESAEIETNITSGAAVVPFDCTFKEDGLHILNFTVTSEGDTVVENNSFSTYVYLVPHENVLIIEYFENESVELYTLLKDGGFNPTVATIGTPDFPTTLEQLRQYDEIILNNVASSDLDAVNGEFKSVLNSYVYEVGGGLFTVGGSEPGNQTDEHAYDINDMAGTQLQEMLPVEAINYTPPIAVMIIIDVSGSMKSDSSQNGKTKLDVAKQAAESLVMDSEILGAKDYCGVMVLADSYDVAISVKPLTKAAEIVQSIRDIDGNGGTLFAPSLDRASRDLRSLYYNGTVQKMSVVVITDGAAADVDEYRKVMEQYRGGDGSDASKITYSFLAIESDDKYMKQLEDSAEIYGGGIAKNPQGSETTQALKAIIGSPEIRGAEYRTFIPQLDTSTSYAKVISQETMPTLGGFYGTRAKQSASVVLSGDFGVPIYAEWKYGAGNVGSFMCDLKMTDWSSEFMASQTGKDFINAVVKKLFPADDIKDKKMNVTLREDNYTTQLSIYPETEFKENETVRVEITNLAQGGGEVLITQPTATDRFSRATFVAKQPGVYEIKVIVSEGDAVKDTYTLYKSFSYSEEYVAFGGNGSELMNYIAGASEGLNDDLSTADRYKVFEGFVTSLHRTYDPRMALIITALVLFLADIAVRKFKFKWPHEIIKAAIEKKKSK